MQNHVGFFEKFPKKSPPGTNGPISPQRNLSDGFRDAKQRAARRRPLNFNFSCFSLRKRVRRTISAWRNRSSVGQALSVQLAHVETPQHKRVEIVGIENAFMVFPVDILFHNNAPFGRPLQPYYQSITFPFHIGISEIKQPPFFRFGSPSLTFRLYYMRRRELCQLFCEKNLKIFQKIFS